MRSYRQPKASSKSKTTSKPKITLELSLPVDELTANLHPFIEEQLAKLSLAFMEKIMEAEIQTKLGPWGKQSVHRHGHQPGYVVVAGRKVRLQRPRLRSHTSKREVPLESYQAFQSKPKMESAVRRLLARQCSTRDYEGALEGHLKGYGIKRSSISRHWKKATAQELKKLCERPVPGDMVALLIDSKYFAGHCIAAAIGLDEQGKKHLLGLWHGATENASVVGALLEDLISRGLSAERKLLVVVDGAKALRKAVGTVFGENALVQRCRVHKQRNVVEQLPLAKQPQAIWRLQAAWSKKDPKEAEKELRKTVAWLNGFSPMAARSLEEGLEETLTLQKLGVGPQLAKSLSSTNMIECCFSLAAQWTRRVKHWGSADMVLRWSAGAFLWAEKRFRRIMACEQMPQLVSALRKENSTTT